MAPELDTTTPQLARALVGQRIQPTASPDQQGNQLLRRAEARQQESAQQVRQARSDVQEANRRLQEAMSREQQASQQVRAARVEQQQVQQSSQAELRGTFVSVLV
ncbi:MAG: hypothetical protein ACOY8P_07155 [Thermodesulfobacteriota bacterium]